MCVCVCVCVCVCRVCVVFLCNNHQCVFLKRLHCQRFPLCVRAACVCVCVCVYIFLHTHTHTKGNCYPSNEEHSTLSATPSSVPQPRDQNPKPNLRYLTLRIRRVSDVSSTPHHIMFSGQSGGMTPCETLEPIHSLNSTASKHVVAWQR